MDTNTSTRKVNGVEVETMVVSSDQLRENDVIVTADGRALLVMATYPAPFGADYALIKIRDMDRPRRFPLAKRYRIAAR